MTCELNEPLISVVVPMYGTAAYLPACLDSVLAQGIDELEVLCIDDGSPDDSAAIAARYAAADPRVQVIRQANAGLGATRTRGAELATGRYLAFLDSDDELPPDAYRHLLAAIEASGSDLVTGDIRRLTSLGARPSPTFSPLYRPARQGTHVRRDHRLLQDRIAPNKLFRTSFWRAHGFSFPSGVLYEDTPVVLRAHVLARQVDVIDRPVYLWRIRQGADRSITQRRLEIRALTDRIDAVRSVSGFLAERGEDELRRIYDGLALTDDLRWFARELDRAAPDYLEVFVREAGALLAASHPAALDDAPALEQLRWHLVAAGDVDGLVALARAQHVAPWGPPVRWGPQGPVLALPAVAGGGGAAGEAGEVGLAAWGAVTAREPLPAERARMDAEAALVTGVSEVRTAGTTVTVRGWAALAPRPGATDAPPRPELVLEEVGGDGRIALAAAERPAPEASRGADDRCGAGFEVEVDAAELAGRWQRGTVRWRLMAEVTAGGVTRRAAVSGPVPGAARRPGTLQVGKLRVGVRWDRDACDVVVAARPVRLVAARQDEDGRLALTLASRRRLVTLLVGGTGAADLELPIEPGPAAGQATVRVDPAVVGSDGPERSLTLTTVDTEGRRARISVDDEVEPVRAHPVGLEVSRYGYASLRCGPPVVELVEVAADPAAGAVRLTLRGVGLAVEDLDVALSARDRDERLPLALEGGTVVVGAGPASLPTRPGMLDLEVRRAGSTEPVRVLARRAVTAALPVEVAVAGGVLRVDDRGWQQLVVVADDGQPADAGTPAGARRAWTEAAADATPGRLGRVLLGRRGSGTGRRGSGGGRRGSGTGRRIAPAVLVVADHPSPGCARAVVAALHRLAPQLTVRWTVPSWGGGRDRAVPDGAVPVVAGSPDWYAALATSRAVVTEVALPAAFVRDPGQRVVRLWSGVPVRPVGRHGAGVRGAEQPADAARAWSDLVTAGPQATTALTSAFDLDLAVHELGLPRHDLLDIGDADRAARRAAARARLGLATDQPAVVHLPTWSDAARHPGGGLRRLDDLDLGHLAAGQDDGAALLVRGHPAVVDQPVPVGDGGEGQVAAPRAVPRCLDTIDVLLAADLVLTHPSSVALEAVRVGVPLVVHDPEGYGLADELGAPYLEVIAAARPAAVTRSDMELAAAVRAVLAGPGVGEAGEHLEVTGAGAAAQVAALVAE